MTDRNMRVSAVAFHAAQADDVRRGLLGWTTFRIGESIVVDGVAVRRTRDGRLTLSFPARRDRQGRDHAIVRPVDDGTRRAIETAVFAALGITEESADAR